MWGLYSQQNINQFVNSAVLLVLYGYKLTPSRPNVDYHSHIMFSEAVQIIRSDEKEDADTEEKQYIIRLVEHYKDGQCLKDILCTENKNLPIFVISICGKERTGKSFILNLMIKYLESNGYNEWIEGAIPNTFEFKGGTKSVTRGLWISPKVYVLTNEDGKKVGVMLLDNQGMFDGEQTDGVCTAISGISTALSFYQIFNVKEKICDNDVETIWRFLITKKDNLTDQPTSASKLMFAVRDYLDEENGCGLANGQAYIEAEKNKGTQSHSYYWRQLEETFPGISCVLLPYPGDKVRSGKAKEMKDICSKFLKETGEYFGTIFDPKNLNDTSNTPTGQTIYDTLKNFDGKAADESMSFINVFTEQGNQRKLGEFKEDFESKVNFLKENPATGEADMEEILNSARKSFIGSSSDEFLAKLERFLSRRINSLVKQWILNGYKRPFQQSSSVEYTHSLQWPSVKKNLSYLVGSRQEKDQLMEEIVVECAGVYYQNLRIKLQAQFQSNCESKSLEELKGFDEIFVSREFKQNKDFLIEPILVKNTCHAMWIYEKRELHIHVQDILLKRVAALTKVDLDWLRDAKKTQFQFYEIFTWNDCHWIQVDKGSDELSELVGYVMYKRAQQFQGCSPGNKEIIKKVVNQLERQCPENRMTLTCIFILYCYKGKESCEPVFKLKRNCGQIFIDIKGRVYEDWKSFEDKNKLPDCLYCHPCNGEYNKKEGFLVAFTFSPASTSENKLLNTLDDVGKVATVASACVIGAALIVPAAPIVVAAAGLAGVASGGYGVVRGVSNIIDKNDHKEEVEPKDYIEVAENGLTMIGSGIAFKNARMACMVRTMNHGVYNPIHSPLLAIEDITCSTVANNFSMFLLFNKKSFEEAITNIRTAYNLALGTSDLDTLKNFIDRNSTIFATKVGERLKTKPFISEGLKSLLLTSIMTIRGQGTIQFLRGITDCDSLRPLQGVFCDDSHEKELDEFLRVFISLIADVWLNKTNESSEEITYMGIRYYPSSEVTKEVTLASVSVGLSGVTDNYHDDNVLQICSLAKKILRIVYKNSDSTDLGGMIAYLTDKREEIFATCFDSFKLKGIS